MTKTISNVLVGVASLFLREPNDAKAEWSAVQQYAGSRSAKLYKGGSGNNGSTHLEFNVAARGLTMSQWTAAIDTNSFYHYASAVLGNFAQFEFRFEDPDSDAWVEITAVPLQNYTGLAEWVKTTLADGDMSGYGGVDELGTSMFNWTLAALSSQQGVIEGVADGADCSNWILSRIRIELWEASPKRTQYIDSVEVMGTTYTIEPGGTAPAMSLDSGSIEIGYTEDGVTMEYTVDETDTEVEEETFAIGRSISKETVAVTCNMAESSLDNMAKAMAGAVRSGNILTLGGGVNKTLNLKIVGINPDGYITEILIPHCTATGAVAMSYKRNEKTVIPVTFQALKTQNEPAVTVIYNAA